MQRGAGQACVGLVDAVCGDVVIIFVVVYEYDDYTTTTTVHSFMSFLLRFAEVVHYFLLAYVQYFFETETV